MSGMNLWMLNHLWKEKTRSSIFYKGLLVSILVGFSMLYLVISLLFLGFYLGDLLRDLFPEGNTADFFFRYFYFYLLISLILRFFLQKLPVFSINNYLHLPVKRSKLFHFLLLRSLFSPFNYLPLLVLVPFAVKGELEHVTVTGSVVWLVLFFSLILFTHFLTFYIKKTMKIRPSLTLLYPIMIAGLFVLDSSGYLNLSGKFIQIVHFLLNFPVFLIIPLILTGLMYRIDFKMLKARAYIGGGELSFFKPSTLQNDFPLLGRFGKTGHLMALELKLIMRNSRPRTILLMSLLFFLYGGYLFYFQRTDFDPGITLVLLGLLYTGNLGLNYGQLLFSWESSYFDFLLSGKISKKEYLNSKYWLVFSLNALAFVCTLPLGFLSINIIIINFLLLIYNQGVNVYLMIFFGTYNSKRIELSKGSFFNSEGANAMHFLLSLALFGIPILIFLPFALLGFTKAGVTFLAMIGVCGIVSRKKLLGQLVSQFTYRKYIVSEGFRSK